MANHIEICTEPACGWAFHVIESGVDGGADATSQEVTCPYCGHVRLAHAQSGRGLATSRLSRVEEALWQGANRVPPQH